MRLLGERDPGLVFVSCIDSAVHYRRGSVKAFVSEVTGIDAGSIICFLSDGQQLRDENVRQLAGLPDDVGGAGTSSCQRLTIHIDYLRVQPRVSVRRHGVKRCNS